MVATGYMGGGFSSIANGQVGISREILVTGLQILGNFPCSTGELVLLYSQVSMVILTLSVPKSLLLLLYSVSFHLSRLDHHFVALFLLKLHCLINFSIRKP